MQSHRGRLVAFALGIAMGGAAADAADLPKEGGFSGTFSSVGTVKVVSVGKQRLLFTWDKNGQSLGAGLFGRFTWHCWGLSDDTNGTGQAHGHCPGTDPVGEQIVLNLTEENHPIDQEIETGSFALTTGTGKYAGITGSGAYQNDSASFPSPDPGSYFGHTTDRGSDTLP